MSLSTHPPPRPLDPYRLVLIVLVSEAEVGCLDEVEVLVDALQQILTVRASL